MSTISDTLLRFSRHGGTVLPASDNALHLVSHVAGPAAVEEIEAAWPGVGLPADLTELWHVAREARLFADAAHGQWGLVLLNPRASAARTMKEHASRRTDFARDDFVVGEFLGDQDLLVLSPSGAGTKKIKVALPLDRRADWYGVANSLSEFLAEYFEARGEKFWEHTPSI